MQAKPYPKYKPSGVEWLGDVPEHWGAEPLKYSTDFINGMAFKPELWSTEGVPIIRIENLNGGTDFNYFESDVPAKYHVSQGDLLFGWSGNRGTSFGPFLWWREGLHYLNQHIFKLTAFTCDQSWFYWCLKAVTRTIEDEAHGIIGMVHVTRGRLGAVPIPVVTPAEQHAIAEFLDRETAKIDTLIAKKRTLIERLKEKHSALISRTVTRGLPPAAARAAGLDPHPRLKPSGIDWLGDVPEHWGVGKFSREVRIAEGQADPEVEPYCSMILVAPNHIESGTGRLLSKETAADQGAISGKYLCRAGEVIYSKIRPALAKAVVAPEDCLCSADMYPMTSTDRLRSRYLLLLLLSSQFTAWSVLEADRVAMPKVNRETLNDLRLPVPPPGEQERIAEFLDRETAQIDGMVAKVRTAIERLQEYRTALVTAAVTGKIDVRGVEARTVAHVPVGAGRARMQA